MLSLAEEAFDLACRADENGQADVEGMASALSLLAHRSCILGDSTAALSQAAQAFALVDPAVPTMVLGELYDTTGWAHFCMGDYAEAYDQELCAFKIAEEVGDQNLLAYVMDSLANVQSVTGHSHEAFDMQTRALTIHRKLGDLSGEATSLNNMAYTKMGLDDLPGALECAVAAAGYADEAGLTLLLVSALDTLCDVHMALGDLDAAEENARRGLDIAVEQDLRIDQTNSLIGLARVSLARNRPEDVKAFALLALSLAEQDQRGVEQSRCHELISVALEMQTDFAGALEHFKSFHELEQTRVSVGTQSRIANLRVEHQLETARKDAEIHRLRSLALEHQVQEGRLVQEELEAQASLDPLTGLYNRGHLPVIVRALEVGLSRKELSSVVVLDVDDFKNINDAFGHLVGDRVLLSVAQNMTASVRDADVVCRWGGDEFLVFLGGTGPEAALATAERIRAAIASCSNEQDGMCVLVTASIGVATASPLEPVSLDALIERADTALYAAKGAGRNRVVASAF
jgi:diguanylate cyclase (GGDEF)-like protein